jgi:hypothetical protein
MPPPPVVWTHAAERRLQTLVDRAEPATGNYVGRLAEVDGLLAAAFPRAACVIVLDLFVGFRPRVGQYIALIDVRDRDRPGTAVVKVATDDAVPRAEADAWAACRPAGVTSDAVFMEQTPRYHPDDRHRLVGVVYQDARRHVTTDRLVSLEEAFVGAVRFGSPDPESVVASPGPGASGGAANVLFDALRRNFYHRAGPPTAVGAEGPALNPDRLGGTRRPLGQALGDWRTGQPLAARALASSTFATADGYRDGYRDPVRFFQSGPVLRRLAGIRVRRGPAHGDLHGRNVLVGIDDNRAVQPALFDYEHMNRDNLIAWDLAKLETELKIRAYHHAYPFAQDYPSDLPPREFLAAVWRAERRLAARDGPDPSAPPAPQRLAGLLTRLRQTTAEHLSAGYDSTTGWEAEYLLAVAAYGLFTARWPARPHERCAALLSAAAAAARLDELLDTHAAEARS